MDRSFTNPADDNGPTSSSQVLLMRYDLTMLRNYIYSIQSIYSMIEIAPLSCLKAQFSKYSGISDHDKDIAHLRRSQRIVLLSLVITAHDILKPPRFVLEALVKSIRPNHSLWFSTALPQSDVAVLPALIASFWIFCQAIFDI